MWKPPVLHQPNRGPLSINIPQEEYLAKLNLSPDTLRAFLSPSPVRLLAAWGPGTPEPEISHTSSEPQSHTTHHTSSEPPRHKPMGEFFPLTDPKTTHDQETQTDKIPEVKVAPPSPPRPAYEIKQMEGYLIINGVKYIPAPPPPPLQHTVETQTDKFTAFKALEASGRIIDSNPFVNCKADKRPAFKPDAALKTDKILDSQPAAAKVEKTSESKPSTVPVDITELKPGASKILKALKYLPTPPESLHRTHSMPSKLPNLSIDIPRFDAKLSGEGSNSDDEFVDI